MAMTDAQWASLAPLVEACRPRSKRPPRDLRRTLEGIFGRHRNGATWRAVPAEYGPWWRSAPLFIRWSRLGAWQRLLGLAQARGVELGLALLDGSAIRAHPKAAGARKRGQQRGTRPPRGARPLARRLRHESLRRRRRARSGGRLRRSPRPGTRAAAGARAVGTACPGCRGGWSVIAATARTTCASRSGPRAPGLRSRRGAARPRSPARPGSTSTATASNGSGPD